MKKSVENLKEIAVDAGIFLLLYLFYKSLWVITLLLPCMVVYHQIHKKEMLLKKRALLSTQFKDMLDGLVASLRAGYSIENALSECEKELTIMYGEDSPICKELSMMLNQIHMGVTAEEVFHGFAKRSAVEDIAVFASVFSIAKRTGGDMVEILRKTAEDIGAKIDTQNEIAVLISSKKLELNIMTLIPMGIIVYIDLTSDGLLQPLYGNAAGIAIMTVCLGIYIAAVLIGRKIMKIEV